MDLAALHRAGRLLITLVDRHRADGPDAALQPCVVHVLDHHQPDRPLSGQRGSVLPSCGDPL